MARAIASPELSAAYLIPGELSTSDDPEDARQWVTIYRELVSFSERMLKRMRSDSPNGDPASGAASDADQRWMESHLRRLESRLEFWEHRFWELAGLDLDIRRRILSHGGQRVRLTRRETELLGFLAQRPGQFYQAPQLISLAWGSPELSAEQLRTYIARLRRHLASTSVPARLVSEPRRGYGLVFTA